MKNQRSVQYGDSIINYRVVRSRRRKKTVEITLDPYEGVTVAAPLTTPNDRIEAMVLKRAGWILRKAGDDVLNPQPRQFVSGESLYYLGRTVRMFVEPTKERRPTLKFDHWSFRVRAPEHLEGEERRDSIKKTFERWYRNRANEMVMRSVERWQSIVGQEPAQVLVRDQKSRWGSCASDGTLRFNWRIVMAPPTLIDYVAAHELCHLLINNHSRKFWDHLARIMPDYNDRRRKLRELGPWLSL